jgi:hypothetical protein
MGWPGQASEHETDHGEADECGDGSGIALEITCQAAIMADPGQSSFDDPAFGQDDEVMRVGTLDDLEHPAACIGDRLCGLRSLIAGIGEDALDEGKATARLSQNLTQAVAILNVGRMHDNAQEEAERIDQDVPLAARNLLARIKALRIERGAPF